MAPPVFLSYRRADEPFAAALVYAVLADRWAGDPVFLDTRFLTQRGDVSSPLLDAVADSELVPAVIGPVWDDPVRRKRLEDPDDWVRRELVAAAEAGKQVVPLLVDRPDVPTDLPFAPVPCWDDPIRVASTDFWRSVDVLLRRVETVLGPPGPGRTPPELMLPAVDAMLRHVLPSPQRRSRNDEMAARVVADELGEREWLRFVATANLPGRPNGSAVVWLTSELVGVADLGSDFRPRTPTRVHHGDVRAVDRVDRTRLWKSVSDLRMALGASAALDLHGFFAEEADELLDNLRRRCPPRS